MQPRFIADVHLGRLARLLRMLGFDTLYHADYTKPQLLKTAVTEERVLLTSTASIAKNPFVQTLIIAHEEATAQLEQVVQHFHLKEQIRPFTRCLVCNQVLLPVAKEAILHLLEPNTRSHFDQFWQCLSCNRIYWQGSHYERMLQSIGKLGSSI